MESVENKGLMPDMMLRGSSYTHHIKVSIPAGSCQGYKSFIINALQTILELNMVFN